MLKDCPEFPEDDKRRILKERADELAKTRPSRSTWSHTDDKEKTTGRLTNKKIDMAASPSCPFVVSDGIVSMSGTGRCDDGSDDSIASPSTAQQAVMKGIARLEAIDPVSIQVALSSTDKPESFTFSRLWKVPRLILELSTGSLALTNILFLVSDAALSSEELLIGLPVFQHLGIDSRTLLERNRAALDGTDCSTVSHPTVTESCGSLGRLMIPRIQRVVEREPIYHDVKDTKPTTPDPNRPRANYYANKFDKDPFPDPNLMDVDSKRRDCAEGAEIEAMIQRAVDNGLPDQYTKPLSNQVWTFCSTFSTRFSSTQSKVDPLSIGLTPDARPVRVKLRNYSPSQRAFMKGLIDERIGHCIVYPNPSSPWACAPLIVPKTGPVEWRFTVDLSPVNKFTIPYQYPMPVIEHELNKTSRSRVFTDADLTHSYWQLLLHPSSRTVASFHIQLRSMNSWRSETLEWYMA